jgi:endonuclease G
MSTNSDPLEDLRSQGITININIGRSVSPAARPTVSVSASAEPASRRAAGADAEMFETKADDELNMDYSGCDGFDVMFMGFKTALPTLDTQLKRRVAGFTKNANQFVLKYDHYSTIHHAVRRMPIVSAVNVEGNPKERKDNAPRKDRWLRDNRIDFDVQLTDDFYKSSGFDKGHMSRREDANWGATATTAEESAQMTCMYTNACPQVPNLNRAVYGYHGLWGELEQIVLEQGVEAETGNASRICVYNGPLFVDSDPVYKGVQVPMRFFKMIVWLNKKGDKKATAFVLSQEDLVGGIQFEELQFDKEFVDHQCSIAYLEKMTSLTFDGISQFDTSPGKGDPNSVGKIDRNGLEALIANHR